MTEMMWAREAKEMDREERLAAQEKAKEEREAKAAEAAERKRELEAFQETLKDSQDKLIKKMGSLTAGKKGPGPAMRMMRRRETMTRTGEERAMPTTRRRCRPPSRYATRTTGRTGR